MVINELAPGLKRTFELCVLNRGILISASAVPQCRGGGERLQTGRQSQNMLTLSKGRRFDNEKKTSTWTEKSLISLS